MRMGDALYFSPNFRFAQLNFDDTKMLIEAFQDRVEGLSPADPAPVLRVFIV